jgi:hypothetical protein
MGWYIKEARILPIVTSYWRRNFIGPTSVATVLTTLQERTLVYEAFKRLCENKIVTTHNVVEGLKRLMKESSSLEVPFPDGSKLTLVHLMDEVFVVE